MIVCFSFLIFLSSCVFAKIVKDLLIRFAEIARPNTWLSDDNGIETMCLLYGTEENGNITIDSIMVPHQRGSRISCEMTEAADQDIIEFAK